MPHKPRKRFGQNFLVDQQIINQIVSTISPKKNDHIIEIGPGKGALTFPLIDYLENIHVIEIDRDLIALLQKKNNIKITIHESDALVFNFDQFNQNIRVALSLMSHKTFVAYTATPYSIINQFIRIMRRPSV